MQLALRRRDDVGDKVGDGGAAEGDRLAVDDDLQLDDLERRSVGAPDGARPFLPAPYDTSSMS